VLKCSIVLMQGACCAVLVPAPEAADHGLACLTEQPMQSLGIATGFAAGSGPAAISLRLLRRRRRLLRQLHLLIATTAAAAAVAAAGLQERGAGWGQVQSGL
jgi:hypothetical protein